MCTYRNSIKFREAHRANLARRSMTRTPDLKTITEIVWVTDPLEKEFDYLSFGEKKTCAVGERLVFIEGKGLHSFTNSEWRGMRYRIVRYKAI